MKYTNTEATALEFTIMGKTYKVAPHGEVDVDPAHVPLMLRRGVKLELSKPKPVVVKPVEKKLDVKKFVAAMSEKMDTKPLAPKE